MNNILFFGYDGIGDRLIFKLESKNCNRPIVNLNISYLLGNRELF